MQEILIFYSHMNHHFFFHLKIFLSSIYHKEEIIWAFCPASEYKFGTLPHFFFVVYNFFYFLFPLKWFQTYKENCKNSTGNSHILFTQRHHQFSLIVSIMSFKATGSNLGSHILMCVCVFLCLFSCLKSRILPWLFCRISLWHFFSHD